MAADTSGGPFGIYFVNPDGSGRRLFLLGGHSPAWSPDGQKLAFVYAGVSMMNIDSTGFKSFEAEGFFPAWSPDGTKSHIVPVMGGEHLSLTLPVVVRLKNFTTMLFFLTGHLMEDNWLSHVVRRLFLRRVFTKRTWIAPG